MFLLILLFSFYSVFVVFPVFWIFFLMFSFLFWHVVSLIVNVLLSDMIVWSNFVLFGFVVMFCTSGSPKITFCNWGEKWTRWNVCPSGKFLHRWESSSLITNHNDIHHVLRELTGHQIASDVHQNETTVAKGTLSRDLSQKKDIDQNSPVVHQRGHHPVTQAVHSWCTSICLNLSMTSMKTWQSHQIMGFHLYIQTIVISFKQIISHTNLNGAWSAYTVGIWGCYTGVPDHMVHHNWKLHQPMPLAPIPYLLSPPDGKSIIFVDGYRGSSKCFPIDLQFQLITDPQ